MRGFEILWFYETERKNVENEVLVSYQIDNDLVHIRFRAPPDIQA